MTCIAEPFELTMTRFPHLSPPVRAGDGLHDLSREYPANYFRLQLLLNTFVSNGVKRVIEVGVGEGTPLATLGKCGLRYLGFRSLTRHGATLPGPNAREWQGS
jgi:hypothetical protein